MSDIKTGRNKKSFQIERRNIQISQPKTCRKFDGERYESTSAIFALGEKSVKIRESHLPRYPTTNHYKLEHIRYEKGNTR